jgi:hypothetical protein
MNDQPDSYVARMDFYAALYSVKNHDLIKEVIEGTDERAKAHLVNNPNLSASEMMSLASNADMDIRANLAYQSHVSPEILTKLRSDKSDHVRYSALSNPLTSFSDFKDGILTGKFSLQSKKFFCRNPRVLKSLELFEFLWNTAKGSHPLLIENLNSAIHHKYQNIDPRIGHIIHDELRSGKASNAAREAYADARQVALPEILDALKDDPHRPVINAIARNSSAWTSTHEYLLGNHKSPGIRIFIIAATEDNDLLNKIYRGTKSKDIREQVEHHPNFVAK